MTIPVDVSFVVPVPEHPEEQLAFLNRMLAQAKSLARPAISQYAVGAVAVGISGKAYLGTNLEFLNQPLSHTVHAEQFAVAVARHHGETGIRQLAVSALPCGHCRQFLLELGNLDLPITLLETETPVNVTLRDLLPYPFLLADADQSLLNQDVVPLQFHEAPRLEDLGPYALDAASRAYVPYTHCYSGVAVRLEDGTIITGQALESAAYNPTLTALQDALIHLVVAQREYHEIREVLLVEMEGAPVSSASTLWNVVKALSPLAQLEFTTAVAVTGG